MTGYPNYNLPSLRAIIARMRNIVSPQADYNTGSSIEGWGGHCFPAPNSPYFPHQWAVNPIDTPLIDDFPSAFNLAYKLPGKPE
jgi:hypothetical protein